MGTFKYWLAAQVNITRVSLVQILAVIITVLYQAKLLTQTCFVDQDVVCLFVITIRQGGQKAARLLKSFFVVNKYFFTVLRSKEN